MLNVSICTIGDEILIGQIVDTNSSVIAKELNRCGIKVNKMLSIQDDEGEIVSTLGDCIESNDIVIITGGLGPTRDDITKVALAKLCKCETFRYDLSQAVIIEDILNRRGIPISQLNKDQALVPECCFVLPNKMGTAPGMVFNVPVKDGHKVLLFSMPGVPYEMEHILPSVIETIKNEFNTESIYHRTLLTYGIPESILASRIESWENNLPKIVKLAYLPNPQSGVKLRLSVYGGNKDESFKIVDDQVNELKSLLGNALYGEGEDTLESILAKFLVETKSTISVAESCTCGKVASVLTSIQGSSRYFKGGVVAYDNTIKSTLLNVREETLSTHGAVSQECVEEMAKGVKNLMNTDYSIATSGIAGPTGGSMEKPVGTVWIAIAGPGFLISKVKIFNGDRKRNIERFSAEALNILRLKLDLHLK